MSDVEKYTARYLVSIGEGKTGVVTHDVYAALASRHERALALLNRVSAAIMEGYFTSDYTLNHHIKAFLKGEAGNE